MELKYSDLLTLRSVAYLLIVLNGIEIDKPHKLVFGGFLLIVLNGIEMLHIRIITDSFILLIVLNGIEINLDHICIFRFFSFNRTKWN